MAADPASAGFTPLRPEAGALPPSIVARAAEWISLLESGLACADDEAACARWRASNPRHELAWQRMAAIDRGLQDGAHRRHGPTPAARQALAAVAEQQARRRLGRWVVGLAGAGVAAWSLREHTLWPVMAAVHRTGTGERRTLSLDDGTVLQLASATAVDIEYGGAMRRILLRAGEVLVQTGHDDPRPLQVVTADGAVSPVGTRFTVERLTGTALGSAGHTAVAVLDGLVDIHPGAGATVRLAAGQQLQFTSAAADLPQPTKAGAGAWSEGMLVADRMRLDAFTAELARWRPGVLRCAEDAAALRITGAFPLDATDRVLATLVQILPVQVEYHTRWWVTVRRTTG